MRKRQIKTEVTPRFLGADQLKDYLGLGGSSAAKLAEQAGARRAFGRRVLYDKAAIDRYLDKFGTGQDMQLAAK